MKNQERVSGNVVESRPTWRMKDGSTVLMSKLTPEQLEDAAHHAATMYNVYITKAETFATLIEQLRNESRKRNTTPAEPEIQAEELGLNII